MESDYKSECLAKQSVNFAFFGRRIQAVLNSQKLASGALRFARDNLRFPRFASVEFALSAAFHVFERTCSGDLSHSRLQFTCRSFHIFNLTCVVNPCFDFCCYIDMASCAAHCGHWVTLARLEQV